MLQKRVGADFTINIEEIFYFNNKKRICTAFDVSQTPNGTKTGENVTIDRYYLKKGNLYIRIRRSNEQKGWIKCLTYSHKGRGKSPLFTNAHYVN